MTFKTKTQSIEINKGEKDTDNPVISEQRQPESISSNSVDYMTGQSHDNMTFNSRNLFAFISNIKISHSRTDYAVDSRNFCKYRDFTWRWALRTRLEYLNGQM